MDKIFFIWVIVIFPLAWGLQFSSLYLIDKALHRKNILLPKDHIFDFLRIPAFLIIIVVSLQILFAVFDVLKPSSLPIVIFERVYIIAIIWFLIRLTSFVRFVAFSKFNIKISDNLRARKIRTQFQFITKSAQIVLIVVGVSAILMTFETLRSIGNSIIASAGLAGIVIGFAAQKTLGTFLSGFQVAFTQPIRIDDVVVVEGEWGTIEEITLTYVVIQIWDLRRLIVPINYFTERTFQNWTRSEAELLAYVFINVDFTTPVDSIRAEFNDILSKTELWNKKIAIVQVTDANEKTIQLRFLMSARNSSESFDLRCLVREKMINFIQKTNFHALPQIRFSDLRDLS